MTNQNPHNPESPNVHAFKKLCEIMTDLRQRCDWDKAQDLHTLRAYLLEETYEVLDALDGLGPDGDGPFEEHRDELGDLLLQIVFQCEIQKENGRFDIEDVCTAITNKLVRRHPHLYGDGQKKSWEEIKREERTSKNISERPPSVLDGIPKHIPGLLRAYRMGEKVHRVGFDWPTPAGVIDKIKEEIQEVEDAIESNCKGDIESELGDLLYAVVNLSRHFEIDPESAIRKTMVKFERRFRHVEKRALENNKTPESCPLEELESYWNEAKKTD